MTAYARFLGAEVRIEGSGRTDAGVHGRHQIASLEAQTGVPEKGILLGVKPFLPEGIVFESPRWNRAGDPARCSNGSTGIFSGSPRFPLCFTVPTRRNSLDLDPEAMRWAAARLTPRARFLLVPGRRLFQQARGPQAQPSGGGGSR